MPVTVLNALPAFLKFKCDSHPGRVVFSHSEEKSQTGSPVSCVPGYVKEQEPK